MVPDAEPVPAPAVPPVAPAPAGGAANPALTPNNALIEIAAPIAEIRMTHLRLT
jgi:hypothetical protein